MKKTIIILSITCICNIAAVAQVRQLLEAAKPKKAFTGVPILVKKSQAISLGIGIPNNLASLLDLDGFASVFFVTSKKNIGPFFVDYEYLIKPDVGLGIGITYGSAEQTYQNDLFGTGMTTASIKGFSILGSVYYHIYTTDKLDTYCKGSLGVNIWQGKYTDENGAETQKFVAPTPVAYRGLVGLRYFVKPKLAPFGELSYSNLKFTANIGVTFKLK